MNLGKKKALAKRTFGVGESRILFVESRLADIKEAITKQDIKDLHKDGAIIIREVKGRKSKVKVKSKSQGKVRVNVNKRKKNYMTMTRKLRRYTADMVSRGILVKDEAVEIRKKIRNKAFRSQAHLKEHIGGMKK